MINEIADRIAAAPLRERLTIVEQSIIELQNAHPDDLPDQLSDAQKVEQAISKPSAALFWRNRAVPALLQEKSSFSDVSLIIAATHPAGTIASPWVAAENWLIPWAEQCLSVIIRSFCGSPGNICWNCFPNRMARLRY